MNVPESQLKFGVVLAIAIFLSLVLGIIFFVVFYQRKVINHSLEIREFNRIKQIELMQASIRSEEEERMRISSELHDDVGATLSAVLLYLSKAESQAAAPEIITQAKEILNQSIQKVRDISHQLQPGALKYLGLLKALQSFTETIDHAGSIKVTFKVDEEANWLEPEPQTALSIYRIVQELVNNIIKHAQASSIQITLQPQDNSHCISISHNGNGLTEEAYHTLLFKKGAIGLKNIENRLKSSNLRLVFPESTHGIYNLLLCMPPVIEK